MLRKLRVPCVSVNEAKRAIVPGRDSYRQQDAAGTWTEHSLKNFDFVIYGPGTNLLIDVKGRRLAPAAKQARARSRASAAEPRLESWVNEDDVRSMLAWEQLFGPDFEAVFVFFYASAQPPAGDLFDEVFGFEGAWYAPRLVAVGDYARVMKPRSRRWRTVDVARDAFSEVSGPLLRPGVEPWPQQSPAAWRPAGELAPAAECPASPWIERASACGLGLEQAPDSWTARQGTPWADR